MCNDRKSQRIGKIALKGNDGVMIQCSQHNGAEERVLKGGCNVGYSNGGRVIFVFVIAVEMNLSRRSPPGNNGEKMVWGKMAVTG